MSDPTKYNAYGRMMTGFNSGIEQSLFGHWSNLEYQQLMQESELQYGICRCCGEQWQDDFWSDDTKTLCLNCFEPEQSAPESTISDIPF